MSAVLFYVKKERAVDLGRKISMFIREKNEKRGDTPWEEYHDQEVASVKWMSDWVFFFSDCIEWGNLFLTWPPVNDVAVCKYAANVANFISHLCLNRKTFEFRLSTIGRHSISEIMTHALARMITVASEKDLLIQKGKFALVDESVLKYGIAQSSTCVVNMTLGELWRNLIPLATKWKTLDYSDELEMLVSVFEGSLYRLIARSYTEFVLDKKAYCELTALNSAEEIAKRTEEIIRKDKISKVRQFLFENKDRMSHAEKIDYLKRHKDKFKKDKQKKRKKKAKNETFTLVNGVWIISSASQNKKDEMEEEDEEDPAAQDDEDENDAADPVVQEKMRPHGASRRLVQDTFSVISDMRYDFKTIKMFKNRLTVDSLEDVISYFVPMVAHDAFTREAVEVSFKMFNIRLNESRDVFDAGPYEDMGLPKRYFKSMLAAGETKRMLFRDEHRDPNPYAIIFDARRGNYRRISELAYERPNKMYTGASSPEDVKQYIDIMAFSHIFSSSTGSSFTDNFVVEYEKVIDFDIKKPQPALFLNVFNRYRVFHAGALILFSSFPMALFYWILAVTFDKISPANPRNGVFTDQLVQSVMSPLVIPFRAFRAEHSKPG
jgi:hypothetical protein